MPFLALLGVVVGLVPGAFHGVVLPLASPIQARGGASPVHDVLPVPLALLRGEIEPADALPARIALYRDTLEYPRVQLVAETLATESTYELRAPAGTYTLWIRSAGKQEHLDRITLEARRTLHHHAELVASSFLHGTVLWAHTHEPIADAMIQHWGLGRELAPRDEVLTNADGSFFLHEVDVGPAYLQVHVPGSGRYSFVEHVKHSGELLRSYLLIPPPVPIEGTVTDARGEPVAGATVRISSSFRRLTPWRAVAPEAWSSSTTDERGRFTLESSRGSRYDLWLLLHAGDLDSTPLHIVERMIDPRAQASGEVLRLEPIVLPADAGVERHLATLVDPSGEPLADLEVQLWSPSDFLHLRSDARGRVLGVWPSEAYSTNRLRVSSPGYWAPTALYHPEIDPPRMRVQPARSQRGIVIDAEGARRPFTKLKATILSTGFFLELESDSTGEFTLERPEGELSFELVSDALEPLVLPTPGDASSAERAASRLELVHEDPELLLVRVPFEIPGGPNFFRAVAHLDYLSPSPGADSLTLIAHRAGPTTRGRTTRWTDFRVDGARLEVWGLSAEYDALELVPAWHRRRTVPLEPPPDGDRLRVLELGSIPFEVYGRAHVDLSHSERVTPDDFRAYARSKHPDHADQIFDATRGQGSIFLNNLPIGRLELHFTSAVFGDYSAEIEVLPAQLTRVIVELPW